MVRILICVALAICLLAVTNARRRGPKNPREPKLTREEVELGKDIPEPWKKNLPVCSRKTVPYLIFHGHSSLVDLELTPNTNEQNTSQVLMKCEEDYPIQPFAMLYNDRSSDKCDRLVVKAKPGNPFLVSSICFKTVLVNFVNITLYTEFKGKKKEIKTEIAPPVGPDYFRQVCVEGAGKRTVNSIEFKYTVQTPRFYVRDLVIWACLLTEERK